MRGMIYIAPRASAANRDGTGVRINPGILYRRQIYDQTIIANSKASRVMAATADREKQIIFSRKIDRANYVRHICAAHNQSRLLVNHPVVDFAGSIMIFIARLSQSTTK